MPVVWSTIFPTTIISLISVVGLSSLFFSDYTQLQAPSKDNQLFQSSASHTSIAFKGDGSLSANIFNLFGKPKVYQDNTVRQDIPETRLQLTLKGTFTHKEDTKQSALVSTQNGATARHFIGDKITTDTEIIDIKPGVVILRRNGQDEILKLPIFSEKQRRQTTSAQKIAQPSSAQGPKALGKQIYQTSPIDTERKNKLKERLTKLRENHRKN